MKFRKKHFWIKDNIYALSILDSKMKTLSEAVDKKNRQKTAFSIAEYKMAIK